MHISISLYTGNLPTSAHHRYHPSREKNPIALEQQAPDLPRLDIEALLGELGRNNGSPRELATSKCLDSLLRRLCILVFDVNLANTEVDAGTGGTGNLGLNDGSVLAALLFDVFLDF